MSLDRLVAEQAIAKLVIRYAKLLDAGDYHQVVEMFTPDGRLVRPSGGQAVVGHDALLAAFFARPARIARHIVCNILVDLETPTQATCSSSIVLFTADNNANRTTHIGGFDDRLITTPDGWRFVERIGSMAMTL